MEESHPSLTRLAVIGWLSLAAAVWVPMLSSLIGIAFYRMMGCGTGRIASVGICDRSNIDVVLNVTRGFGAFVLVSGLSVAVTCCLLLIGRYGRIRHSVPLQVAAWGLVVVLVIVVVTLVMRTPWDFLELQGLSIFLYGTVSASIIVAVSALLLAPAIAVAKRIRSSRS